MACVDGLRCPPHRRPNYEYEIETSRVFELTNSEFHTCTEVEAPDGEPFGPS